MKKPLPPKEVFQPLVEMGIPWEVLKAGGLPALYVEMVYKPGMEAYKRSKGNFNPFTDDPNCKTCKKKRK